MPVTDTFKEKVITAPNGLKSVQRSGRITGTDADTYLSGTIIPAFTTAYPTTNYAVTSQSTFNASKNVLIYLLRATENAAALPGSTVESNKQSVTTRKDRAGRTTTTTNYDILTSADPSTLIVGLRPAGTTEEQTESRTNPERRLLASFTTVSSSGGNYLIEWNDSLDETFTDPDTNTWTYVQSGRAVGQNKFPKPPSFILSVSDDPVKLTYKRLNEVDCETTWKYSKEYTTRQSVGTTQVNLLVRPGSPTFW